MGDLGVPSVSSVPWWGLVSATAAPVLLVGGWTLAAARQPGGFDPVAETISALAGRSATDRWVMTTALVGVGAAHLVTSAALRGVAARPGRRVLALGGVATVLVAAVPLDGDGTTPAAHTAAAAVAFLSLAAWPAVAGPGPGLLRTPVSRAAAAGLLGLVGWLFAELTLDAGRVGLAERVAAGAQALWPLAVVAGAVAATGAGRRSRRALS